MSAPTAVRVSSVFSARDETITKGRLLSQFDMTYKVDNGAKRSVKTACTRLEHRDERKSMTGMGEKGIVANDYEQSLCKGIPRVRELFRVFRHKLCDELVVSRICLLRFLFCQ